MKNERLLAMTDYLLRCGRKTAEELAARFEVSTRTIYRDIDSLCAAGVPIAAEAGTGGGYQLEESYRIDRSFLSADEIADLSSLLEGLAEAVKDSHLERSLGKISSLGPRGTELTQGSPCIRLPPPLIATFSPWGAAGGNPQLVREIRRAIAERRVIEFAYVDAEAKETARKVEPYSLVLGGATWYLHCWCRLRGSFRLFKLVRMRNAHLVCERFDPYAHAPVPSPFAFSDSTEIPVPIAVLVEARLQSAMEEAFPGAGCGPDERGRWTYRFTWPLGNYLIHFLLLFWKRPPRTGARGTAGRSGTCGQGDR